MPHQAQAVQWEGSGAGGLCCRLIGDEMRVGKTPTAIAIDYRLRSELARKQRGNDCTLIVCPKSVIDHWVNMLLQMGVRSEQICKVDLPKKQALCKVLGDIERDKRKANSSTGTRYVVINWDTVQTIERELRRAGPWFHIIGDEIHRIKGRTTKRTEAFKKLKAKQRTGLSGTPADNRPEDFWSVLNWLMPQTYTSYWSFVEEFCNTGEAPIMMADLTFKRLDQMAVGDKVVGWDSDKKLTISTVEAVAKRQARVVKGITKSGNIIRCTPDHRWLSGASHSGQQRFVHLDGSWENSNVRLGRKAILSKLVDVPKKLSNDEQWHAGYLGAIMDGEGTWPHIGQDRNINPETHSQIIDSLLVLGFCYRADSKGVRVSTGMTWNEKGGIAASKQRAVNFMNWCKPAKNQRLIDSFYTQRWKTNDEVVSIEDDGVGDVYSMQTSTGNYFAWGYASKNCNVWTTKAGYKKIDGVKHAALPKLREAIRPFYIRRRLVDVAGSVPQKQYRTTRVSMGARQRREYDEMQSEGIVDVQGGDILADMQVVVAVRLQQMAIGCCVVEQDGDVHISDSPASPKLDAVMEQMKDEPELGPYIVFAQHHDTIRLLNARLANSGYSYASIIGTDKSEDRTKAVARYQNGEAETFTGTIGACREGITLSRARTIIFIDRCWNPNWNRQAEARADDLTSNLPVTIITLECIDSIDEDRRLKINQKGRDTDAITATSN